MVDDWPVEQWKAALDAHGTEAEDEAYARLAHLLYHQAQFLLARRASHPYLQRQSDQALRHWTEDLVHATIERVRLSYDKFEWRAHIRTYAISIMINELAHVLRKSFATREVLVSYDEPEDDSTDTWDIQASAVSIDPSQLPEVLVENREFREALQRCIEKLPTKQRQAFWETVVVERRTDDVARTLNMTAAALLQNVSRARHSLRDCLDRAGYVSPGKRKAASA